MKTHLTIPLAGCLFNTCQLHILGICLTLITACSVFKEKSFLLTDSLQRQHIRREVKTETKSQVNAVRIYSQEDSSDRRSFTEIVPEGFFRYSSHDGFSGKASRVLMYDRTKESKKVRDSTQFRQVKSTLSKTGETRRMLSKTRVKEKDHHANNSIAACLAGLLLIFAGVFLFRRRLFK